MRTPKNITDLRNDLLYSFAKVKASTKAIPQAQELANTAGKIIQSVKVQLEYASLLNEQPDIPFLGKTTGKKISTK